MRVQVRQELIDDGIEFVPSLDDYNEYVSAENIEQATFLDCDDEGCVTLELSSGKVVTVYSIDLEFYEN